MNKKILMVSGITLTVILIGYLIYFFVRYDLLVCNSKEGSIIIVYDDENLVNFGTKGNMSFNFENQKSYVEKIGIESFISSFEKSFEKNTNGKCK